MHHKMSANSDQNLMNDNDELLPFYTRISEFKVKINDTSLSVYTFCIRMFLLISTGAIIYGMTESGMANLLPRKAGETDNINQWIEIFLCITTYVTTIIISWYYSRKHIENINENFTCAIFMIYLTGILNVITKRFDFINNILKNCVSDDNYGKNRINDILFGFKIHTKLCNIMRDTNELSGVILLAFMGYSFYKITTDSYNSFVQVTQQTPSLLVLQNCAVWLVLNIFLLIIITECCGNVTSEANVTSQILSRSYGKDKNYKNIIDKFLTKSINQELEFTAYGFFAIDSSTLFTILSAVTTYLVILIQFKQLENTGDTTEAPTTKP
ncbi:gustatory and pheromone receptor 32a [Condylostylus longicornis]|uniref:gustatory and pheromone receptor 32a n=1 Tax=Condylostylus longicornis TaxID=2530218 RepID=UPI00244DFFC7|nr:gustatory and pheromone receptor 32a [Condylostylus longicornis]